MPVAVPISFPSQKHGSTGGVSSSIENPVMISPNLAFRGSPMSYKILTGSFGSSRQNQPSMPGFSMSPMPLSASFSELNDFRVNGVPSSLESEAGKILRALNSDEGAMDEDLVQNYSCCGLELSDLHALLEHFESCHVVVVDDEGNVAPARPPNAADDSDQQQDNMVESAFDPDAMDLDDDSSPASTSTPPRTPPTDLAGAHSPFDGRSPRGLAKTASTLTGYSTPRGVSPHPINSAALNEAAASILSGAHGGEAAFNPYASYADFSSLMPGTVRTPIHQTPDPNPSGSGAVGGGVHGGVVPGGASSSSAGPNAQPLGIQPALLFSPSTQTTPTGTPVGSRSGTPVPGSKPGGSSSSSSKKAAALAAAAAANGGVLPPQSKPFKCPTPGCNKSYKQANGLKYHITHGQCNFMPRDPALEGLPEHEADEKARPYVCQVGTCTRRYKNMNGLRYHYQHTGTHGAMGLALLASGQHSLQTGLKEAGVELAPQIKEQDLLAAQALQAKALEEEAARKAQQLQQHQQPSPPPSPSSPSALSAAAASAMAGAGPIAPRPYSTGGKNGNQGGQRPMHGISGKTVPVPRTSPSSYSAFPPLQAQHQSTQSSR